MRVCVFLTRKSTDALTAAEAFVTASRRDKRIGAELAAPSWHSAVNNATQQHGKLLLTIIYTTPS